MESMAWADWLGAGASLIAIVGGFYAAMRWGKSAVGAAFRWLTRFKPTVPRETIRAVPRGEQWWGMGSVRDEPAMQVVTDWLVTNISDRPTIIARAFMRRGWLRKDIEARYIINSDIPAYTTKEMRFDFWPAPPFRKDGQRFQARLVLVDHLGNHHRTVPIEVCSRWRPKKDEEERPVEEELHTIANPVVKQAIAILKDEKSRYAECGRQSGGLGSVQVTYQGRTLAGIGYQGWESNSARQQWIVHDPEKAHLHSDNCDLIVELYSRSGENDKKAIVKALLDRIQMGSEYTPIAYFSVFALFRIGHLRDALLYVRGNMREDKTHGFSNAVKMLSGLLQYSYRDFDDATLDKVERFMTGLEGYLFKLKERCYAARTALHQREWAVGIVEDQQSIDPMRDGE